MKRSRIEEMTSEAAQRRGGPRRHGFMYVELLVSLFVLSVALLAVVPLLVLAASENAAASDLTLAAVAALEKEEELRAADFASLTAGQDRITHGSLGFDRTWVVEADVPQAGMKAITVTVIPVRQNLPADSRRVSMRFYRER